jgi:hypothetical protein
LGVERNWIVPACLFIAVEQALCLLLGSYHQFDGAPPYVQYGVAALSAFGLATLGYVTVDVRKMMRAEPDSPIAYLKRSFAARKERFVVLAIGCALTWLQFVTLTWTKALIPHVTPMWADLMLADADKWIFGGDPWRLLHQITATFEPTIDLLYSFWMGIIEVCLGAVLLAKPSRNKSAVLLGFFLMVGIVGVLGQFILPSGGPIFWERLGLGDRFSDMIPPHHSNWVSDFLWEKYLGDQLGFANGISAFPSMHVAGATWMVIAMRLIYPKVQFLLWFYFVIVLVGSVALGWHYAMDGVGAIAGTILCFVLARAVTSASIFQRPLPTFAFARTPGQDQ